MPNSLQEKVLLAIFAFGKKMNENCGKYGNKATFDISYCRF